MPDLRAVNERLMTGRPPRVLFCGSRDGWRVDVGELIGPRIDALPDGSVVIHGRARGADTIAGQLAVARGLFCVEVPIQSQHWQRFGKRAGDLRNGVMGGLLDPEHDWVEAFFSCPWPARTVGTLDMLRQAEMLRLPMNAHWAGGERMSSSGLGAVTRA